MDHLLSSDEPMIETRGRQVKQKDGKMVNGMPMRPDARGRGRSGSHRVLPVVLCLTQACVLALFPASAKARHHDNAENLREHIGREKNPIKKAKLEIRLGRLELDQAASAYDQRQIPQGQKLLSQSTSEMQDAWNVLKSTRRNAAKHSDGFLQLEIGLRENARLLRMLRQRVFYLYRGPIDETLKTLNQTHSEVLLALFPGAIPPAVPGKGKGKIQAYQNPAKGIHP
jgi:hypothetical protein